ncbi:ATP synthase j chain domain containing protein [Tylopilus felleus]
MLQYIFFWRGRFNTPVIRPMAPFLAASAITFYLVGQMQELGVRSETYAKDPKNPYAAQIAREAESHH